MQIQFKLSYAYDSLLFLQACLIQYPYSCVPYAIKDRENSNHFQTCYLKPASLRNMGWSDTIFCVSTVNINSKLALMLRFPFWKKESHDMREGKIKRFPSFHPHTHSQSWRWCELVPRYTWLHSYSPRRCSFLIILLFQNNKKRKPFLFAVSVPGCSWV